MTDLRAGVIWSDFNGVTRQTILNTLLGSTALQSAMQSASNAEILTSWEGSLSPVVGVAVAASYQSVKSAATLVFQTGSGSIVRLTLPSPLISCFLADKITIDPSNALIIAIVATAVGHLTDGAGNAVTSFVGGFLQPGRNDLPSTEG